MNYEMKKREFYETKGQRKRKEEQRTLQNVSAT